MINIKVCPIPAIGGYRDPRESSRRRALRQWKAQQQNNKVNVKPTFASTIADVCKFEARV